MGLSTKTYSCYLPIICKNLQNYEKFARFLTTTFVHERKMYALRLVLLALHMHYVVCVVTVIRSKQNCSLCAKIECICIVVV